MPRFESFRALRYAPGSDLSAVIAAPYDVLSPVETEELRARDPHNIVWIDVPNELDGDNRYTIAASRLRDGIADGTYLLDDDASFTIYRMRFNDATGQPRDIAGVLGALEVTDAGAGGVLPHERTTPKASTDRLDLTRATGANMSPVWGLSMATGLTALLAAPGEPVGTLVVDGVAHIVERVSEPTRCAAISACIAAHDVLIADGHHRYAVARQYRDEVRAATGNCTTAAELTLAFVNELIAEQLSIAAIHRLYDAVSLTELRAALANYFDLSPAPAPTPALLAEMVQFGRLVLLHSDGSSEWLIPKTAAFLGVRALDGAWLEHALATIQPEVSYQHGLAELCAVLPAHTAAVLVRPTSLTEIMRTATERLLMPPKSTFFTPKLRTGLVVRLLDDTAS
ncbi:MAG: DUF1015 domain-containing protein [Propionibacteriaceae bacterium]|jgi:uncharacterized protein (DUF1015 family)|nr:DUF1015 domain-containing protein [Propionibacteriaceae bacterium]